MGAIGSIDLLPSRSGGGHSSSSAKTGDEEGTVAVQVRIAYRTAASASTASSTSSGVSHRVALLADAFVARNGEQLVKNYNSIVHRRAPAAAPLERARAVTA